jgi:hypothetical protein
MKIKKQDALYILIYYSKSVVYVSGYVLAHHQEHLTVFTVSGSVHPSCCRLVSWMSWSFSLLVCICCTLRKRTTYTHLQGPNNTGCFKKSFTTLKAYRNLYRGHTQRFELSKCSKTGRVLPRIVIRNCFDLFFRFLLHGASTITIHRPGKRVFRYSRTSPR